MNRSDDINFHCDVCNVDFYVASAMLYHNKFFHRQDTDLPSIGQSKKFKNINQEVLLIYYCAFCGEEYDNKVNLHKHMVDDHSDENQSPDDVLRCPLCEAIFYHLDAYELHLTFHSSDDLYSEKNEMFEQIEEFSLETVPPIMEKVENIEPQDVETAMNAVGLDTFLEMAIDNDKEYHKKSKKHKKHKKSKKPAITLDEFLNMNTDVFGEGLDFQGIEEVPTQVVAKRLKQKKANKPTGQLKVLEGKDLEKLKKQGIVVKMKAPKMPPMPNIKIGSKVLNKPMVVPKQNISNKPSSQSQTPDEVLSKLLNQSSQIKIVKKQHQNASNTGSQMNLTDTEISAAKRLSPENIEVECDVQSGYTSSETEAKEESSDQDKKSHENCTDMVLYNHGTSKQEKTPEICNESWTKKNESNNEKEFNDNYINNKVDSKNTIENISKINTMDNLKNISQNVTIKPSCSTLSKIETQECESDKIQKSDALESDLSNSDSNKLLLEKPDSKTKNSLDALKHLSHLITIKSVNSKASVVPAKNLEDTYQKQLEPNVTENLNKTSNLVLKQEVSMTPQLLDKNEPLKLKEGLKSLNKNITIKSLTHSPTSFEDRSSNDEEFGYENCRNSKSFSNQSSPLKTVTVKNTDVNVQSSKPLPKMMQINKNSLQSNISEQIESQNKNSNLLKRLTNITAKPIGVVKSNQLSVKNKSSSNVQVMAVKNTDQHELKKQINEEIEIFNIDDSESDVDDNTDSAVSQINKNKIVKTKNTSNVSFDKLKTLSKNITVKSVNRQIIHQNTTSYVKQEQNLEKSANQSQSSMSDFSDEDEGTLIPTNLKICKNINLQNSKIQNTLKNLGKHITVKSRNSSPSTSIKSNKEMNLSQDSKDKLHNDSDNDSIPDKVKITEVYGEDVSEGEMEKAHGKNNEDYEKNMIIQSPADSNSDIDNNRNDDTDGELSDFESQLQASTIKKPLQSMQGCINKDMNKKTTIKSNNKCNNENESTSAKNVSRLSPGSNKELFIKPIKQTKIETDNTSIINKNVNLGKVARYQSAHHNVASNSQLNTVNKEVTVKTFQTKTVIEEITTTVTKTIKTVNQTVKQQLQSTSQSAQPIISQKSQRMPPNPLVRNFQGITVRNATPHTGTKIRGMLPFRAPTASPLRGCNQIVPVRSCNQLVPIRSASNIHRPTGQRMPAVKKIVSSTPTNSQSVIGKQLQMSPVAVNTAMKRPTEDSVSHFSCFKKPKESLIPVSDIPSFDNSTSSEASVHYTSQSKDNYSSATKTIKGNTVVTHMKSETSSGSQHFSKLNSLSGLTIVKTNQSKQTMQVEEKCEVSASKRNTMEAIEKLQKQGLLIKKPRVDANNDIDASDYDDEYLAEEPDQ